MAVQSKATLQSAITADPTFTANQKTILGNTVDSYEDIFQSMDTTTRNAIASPTAGLIIYNTDTDTFNYYDGSAWREIGQPVGVPITTKVNLTSSDLLGLNTTPKLLVPAPGAGYAIAPISMAYRGTYGTTDYDFVDDIVLQQDTGTVFSSVAIPISAANSSADYTGTYPVGCAGVGTEFIVENKHLELFALTSNPTVGDGTLTVWVTYAIITW